MNCLTDKEKQYINNSYTACMNGTATEEQKLVWKLANAVHCVRVRWMTDDIEKARELLYEHDYIVNNIEGRKIADITEQE